MHNYPSFGGQFGGPATGKPSYVQTPTASPDGEWTPEATEDRVLALDHMTHRVGAINARLSDLTARVVKHADSIFGGSPSKAEGGNANVPPQPSARLEGLAQALNATERYLEFLDGQVERFRAL